MRFLDLTLPGLAENLALDEALLLDAEATSGPEVLRLWEWPRPAVVLGAGCALAQDVDEAACRADGVPILRRASGGGTVLLGSGCLVFSLVLRYARAPDLREVRSSYRYILQTVCAALGPLLRGAEPAGTSDLSASGRKFSGNSQQRKRNYLLHHGTLLYRFEIALVERYLRMPAGQPAYRERRPHDEFLCNLPADRSELADALRTAWEAGAAVEAWPRDLVEDLAATKYRLPAWNRRR